MPEANTNTATWPSALNRRATICIVINSFNFDLISKTHKGRGLQRYSPMPVEKIVWRETKRLWWHNDPQLHPPPPHTHSARTLSNPRDINSWEKLAANKLGIHWKWLARVEMRLWGKKFSLTSNLWPRSLHLQCWHTSRRWSTSGTNPVGTRYPSKGWRQPSVPISFKNNAI